MFDCIWWCCWTKDNLVIMYCVCLQTNYTNLELRALWLHPCYYPIRFSCKIQTCSFSVTRSVGTLSSEFHTHLFCFVFVQKVFQCLCVTSDFIHPVSLYSTNTNLFYTCSDLNYSCGSILQPHKGWFTTTNLGISCEHVQARIPFDPNLSQYYCHL